MQITRFFGLTYIISSWFIFYLHILFPHVLEFSSKWLKIVIPLMAWIIILVFTISILSGHWRKFRRSENWLIPQLILLTFTGIANHTVVYSTNGIIGPEGITNDILDSFYFSIVTWTTLGYGDFQPTTSVRFVAASEALMGYFSVGLFFGVYFEAITGKRLDKDINNN